MESPFASRLGTTFIPSDEEVVEIRKILDEQIPKLAHISSELARVKALYEELENQHKQLVDDMDAHRKLLSLPRRNLLPTDVLQEIFLSCLPINHDSIITKKEAPILLTQVCGSWRRIALNTPLLWASIHIPINPPFLRAAGDETATELRMMRRVTAVREWLSRSKDCPLSFTFGSNPNTVGPYQHCDDIISLLLLRLTRWRRVSISASKYYVAIFMALDGRRMPLLESITIRDLGEGGWSSTVTNAEICSSQLSLFENPNLRTLTMFYLTQDITSLPVRWAALSHLSLHHNLGPVEVHQIFDLLKSCTRLVTFHLGAEFHTFTPILSSNQPNFQSSADTVVSLPFLEKFSLYYHTEVVCPDIFDSLELPALREINYHWIHRSSAQPPLLSLLRKQGHSIATLNTNIGFFSEESFRSCLRCCPHLKKLAIVPLRAPGMDGDESTRTTDIGLLESFSSSSSGEYLCPELEVLESSLATVSSDQDVLDFLTRKQAGTLPGLSKMKSLGLIFSREQKQPMAEFVRPYIEEGLDLGLAYRFLDDRGISVYDHLPIDLDVLPERSPGPALF